MSALGKKSDGGLVRPVELELTILMPCLNEAETIGTCIRNAQAFLARKGVAGEILVADNGSTDEIARHRPTTRRETSERANSWLWSGAARGD